MQQRRRQRLFWPYCQHWGHPHWGPWSVAPFGPPWWERPSADEEKEAISEHIDALKEELQAAEAYLKQLEETGNK
jgi:hypothetical protein